MSQTLYGIPAVLAFIEQCKGKYWRIFDKDGMSETSRRVVSDNFWETESNIDACKSSLQEFLKHYAQYGFRGYLCISQDNKIRNTGCFTWIEIPGGMQQNQVAGIGSVQNPVDITNEVAMRVKAELDRRELEQLRNENKELKKQCEHGPLDRIADRIEPYTDIIMAGIFGVKPAATRAISGVKESLEEAQKIAEEALEELSKDDENFHITLKKLAYLKKNDPEKYKLAKSML